MNPSGPEILAPNIRRGRWRRVARDIFLLPPAFSYVIIEQIFWRGAKQTLRQASRVPAVKNMQNGLQKLPPAVIVPMFLIPEAFSHIGGFWASDLLVQKQWTAAILVGVLVKGVATLVEVWIYQSCEQKLLSVKWFAWLHRHIMAGKDWVDNRTKPARSYAKRLFTNSRSGLASRFNAIRSLLTRRLHKNRK